MQTFLVDLQVIQNRGLGGEIGVKMRERKWDGIHRCASNLGCLHLEDREGVPKDLGAAVTLLRRSSELGEVQATYTLVFLYSGHHGDGENWEEARECIGEEKRGGHLSRTKYHSYFFLNALCVSILFVYQQDGGTRRVCGCSCCC